MDFSQMSSCDVTSSVAEEAFGDFPNGELVRIDDCSDADLAAAICDAKSSHGTEKKLSPVPVKKSSGVDDAMVAQTLSRISRNGKTSCRKEICDTVVKCGSQRKSDPNVSMTVLNAAKRWAKQQNSRTAQALIQSGLAKLCLEIGKVHVEDAPMVLVSLEAIYFIIRCGKKMAIAELESNGLGEFLNVVDKKHSSHVVLHRELKKLKAMISTNGSSSIFSCF
jgi:hypothetical protein